MCNSHCRHILYYAGRSCVDPVCFWLRISFVVNTPTARLIHYCLTTHHAGNRASSPVQTPTGHLVISLHRPVVHIIIIVNSFSIISHIIQYCQSVADILISLRLVSVIGVRPSTFGGFAFGDSDPRPLIRFYMLPSAGEYGRCKPWRCTR